MPRKRLFKYIALSITLLSSIAAAAYVLTRPTLEDIAITNTIAKLKDNLRDPDSLKLIDVYTVRKNDESKSIAVCGFFDSKNAFGGYSGKTRFRSLVHNYSESSSKKVQLAFEDELIKEYADKVGKNSVFVQAAWNYDCVDENHPEIKPPPRSD